MDDETYLGGLSKADFPRRHRASCVPGQDFTVCVPSTEDVLLYLSDGSRHDSLSELESRVGIRNGSPETGEKRPGDMIQERETQATRRGGT